MLDAIPVFLCFGFGFVTYRDSSEPYRVLLLTLRNGKVSVGALNPEMFDHCHQHPRPFAFSRGRKCCYLLSSEDIKNKGKSIYGTS